MTSRRAIRVSRARGAILWSAALFLIPFAARAAFIRVTDFVDDADVTNGTCTLREAVRSANDNVAIYMLEVPYWTHRALWHLLLSGKFDKFPGLKYAVVECGSYWIGDLLWKADVSFGASGKVKKMSARTKGLIERLPSEYFGTNVFIGASTMNKVEIRRRHMNGIDALMWGTDYPHPEGSWPHTVERLETDFRDVPIEDTRRLLGTNAIECYDLDVAGLTDIAARIGPTPESFGQDPALRTPPDAVRQARWWFDEYNIEWKG